MQGVTLKRAGLDVKSRELKAYLKEDGDSSLEKAIADGAVDLVQVAAKRSRRGKSEHAEYYAGEEKIVLEGGEPEMVDSVRGATRGKQLTYFANDDRLLVNGAPDRPATTVLHKR